MEVIRSQGLKGYKVVMDEHQTISAYSKLSLSFGNFNQLGAKEELPTSLVCISEVGLTQSWESGRAHQPSFYSAQSSRLRRTEAEKPSGSMQMRTPGFTWQLHIPVKWKFC